MINDEFQFIYNHLADETSKNVYVNRLLYSMTHDIKYLRKQIESTIIGRDFSIKYNKFLNCHKQNVIFGAGIWGSLFQKTWLSECLEFVDNDSNLWGKTKNGVKIISPSILSSQYKDAGIIIANRFHNKEIEKQLMEQKIPMKNVFNAGKYIDSITKGIYFDLPNLTKSKDEIFVDVGCFDGSDSIAFTKWTKGKYKHIFSFEADLNNQKKCNEKLRDLIEDGKISLIKKGLWNKCTEVKMNFAKEFSTFSKDGVLVPVTALDIELKNQPITFIKMDIEGAELKALHGCENIIKNHKPKLAISIYHKNEDIFKIPSVLLKYNPDYQFYIRHYSLCEYDTVLYAI